MAHLSAYSYGLLCTKRGQVFFPHGRRDGLLIGLWQGEDLFGVGEYAPFTGIHACSIDDALTEAQNCPSKILSSVCSLNIDDTYELAHVFDSMPKPLGYILSMAHFHGTQKARFGESLPSSFKLWALIEANGVGEAVELAQCYLAQGFNCLKIKVGSLPIEDEIQKLRTIAAVGGNSVRLRLDANKKLTLAEAINLVVGLKRIKIEFFEEPLRDITEAKQLHEETGVEIALDESFGEIEDLDKPYVKFLIMKPSRFTSIYHVMNLVCEALRLDKSVVFSHCFESEYSAAIYAMLINNLGLAAQPHGILAEGFFKHGIFSSPLRSFRGSMSLANCRDAITNNFLTGPALTKAF